MIFESLDQALEAFKKLQQTRAAYNHAMGVLMVDATTAAPSDSWEGRGRTMEVLSKVSYDLETNPDNESMLAVLEAHREELDSQTRREVEVFAKSYRDTRCIPAEEYVAYNVLLNDAQGAWAKAKTEDDFASFAPYLEKIVEYSRKFAGYYNPELAPYDALLDQFEEGLRCEKLDAFFAQLRSTIVPLLEKIKNAPQIDDSFLFRSYPVEQQRKLSKYIMRIMGLDSSHCTIAETEHPFTESFNNKDVRITTRYEENNFAFAMSSTIHEGGHALYELGGDDCYNFTVLQGGISMSIHESQSRFYENYIGKSEAFIHAIFPELQKQFPEQLSDVDEAMFYRGFNRCQPSLIRTEADELTYALHIMVRYQIEKEMIGGSLKIADVPARWNALYKEYLGVDVPNDREGCLQDSHWAGGAIGYFPSYALGSAYGAQFLAKMQEQIGDVYEKVAEGDLSHVTAWLRENIHRYAGFKKPDDIIKDICGEFDGSYFTDYLTKKFTALYNL